jgi:hypothetical protein
LGIAKPPIALLFDKSPAKIFPTAGGLFSRVVAVHGQLESRIFYNRIEECQQVFSDAGKAGGSL